MKYIFRGITILDYDPATKNMTAPDLKDDIGTAFNFCNYIPEDYFLLSDFFNQVGEHASGLRDEARLKDVEVG